MLTDCIHITTIWHRIDQLGSVHWDDYVPLNYGQIPNILKVYGSIAIYHMSELWSFWVTWCKHFYDPEPINDWKVEILTKFKEQFYKRITEAPCMTHWIKLAQRRRTESDDVLDDPIKHTSERGFLLIHTPRMSNSTHSICGEDGLDPDIEKWIGKGHLVTVDYDALHGNKPRLKLNHLPWVDLVLLNDPSVLPPNEWTSSLPLSVIGTKEVKVVSPSYHTPQFLEQK